MKINASGLERAINCPGSVKLSVRTAVLPQTEQAKEGELAHKLASVYLNASRKVKIPKKISEDVYFSDNLNTLVQEYVKFCFDNSFVDGEFFIEKGIDLSTYLGKNARGYVDFACLGEKTLFIADLKFGQGTWVNAKDNAQLYVYALGLLDAYDFEGVNTIRIAVYQPRMNNIQIHEVSTSELRNWWVSVQETVQQAIKGSDILKTGEHCKYCPAMLVCPRQKDLALNILGKEYAEFNDEDKIALFINAKNIREWLDLYLADLKKDVALGKVEGLKMVAGTQRRYFPNPESLPDVLTKRVPVTLSEAEMLMLPNELEKYVALSPANPTIALASSNKAAYFGPLDGFDNL